jgi:hypothetical protein
MDDPGWDTPGFDDEPATPVSSPSPAGGGGDGKPPWTQPKWLGIGGGALAVVVIIVLIAILLGRGGSPTPTPTPTPVAANSTILTPSASPTPSPTSSPSPTKKSKPRKKSTGESLASYDHQADVICSEYNPRIDPAVADNNLPRVADLIIDELGKIQKLRTPDDDGDEAEKWVNAVTGYWESLNSGNVPSFKQQLQSADSLAIELGMKSCGRSK